MNDSWNLHFPEQLSKIRRETEAAGFRMASDELTGSLLCTLVDDLLPQPSWPDGHAPRIPDFLSALERHDDFNVTRLAWSTGLVIATKRLG
jgi:hypothetical protein